MFQTTVEQHITDIEEPNLGHEIRGMVQSGCTQFVLAQHMLETGELIFDVRGFLTEWVEPIIEDATTQKAQLSKSKL